MSEEEFSAELKALTIVPKPFAILSLLGSSYIVYHVLHNQKQRRTVKYQILLGLSLSDILFSIAGFLGTFPIPAYVNDEKPTIYLASGNDQTCNAHAFFIQWTIMTPIYNASLSLYYVLVVKLGWNERKLKKMRWWFHIPPIGIGLGTAIAGAALDIYGNATLWCWIIPGSVYRWAFYYGILWVCALVFIIPSMIIIYLHVRKQESKVAKWQRNSGQQETYANSRKVMQQGLFFSLSFIITWIFPTLTRLMQSITGSAPFPLILLMTIFLPMQGLINAMVFLRPKYAKYRKDNPEKSFCYLLSRTVFTSNFSGSVVVAMFNKSSADESVLRRHSSTGDEVVVGNEDQNEVKGARDEPETLVERRNSTTNVQWADESRITSSSIMVGDIEEMKVDEEEKTEEG